MPRPKPLGLCALALCLCLAACGPAAESAAPSPTAAPAIGSAAPTASPSPTPGLPYEAVALFVDKEEISSCACRKDGAVFVPFLALCSAFGVEASYAEDGDSLTAQLAGRELSANAGDGYMLADGRYLYIPGGWLTGGGELFLPSDTMERLLGVFFGEQDGALYVASENLSVISGGDDYYDVNFAYDDQYWLAHVIYAESHGQPLAGMIGVGNVVLNRVADADFPYTVMAVVYDVEHAVQFEPVSNGSIKAEPDEQSYIAARLCLEGFNTVGDSLYFVNPAYGSSWFDSELEFVTAIGDHNFYK